MKETRRYRVFDWVGRHITVVGTLMLVLAVALGVVGTLRANTDEPSFDPSGALYDTAAYVEETLHSSSTVHTALWLVEAPDGGNVLTRDALIEWKQRSEAVRQAPESASRLVDRYDTSTGAAIPGIVSIADVVDQMLPGGLESASETDVQLAVAAALSEGSPVAGFRSSLSEGAELTGEGWNSKAFTAQVVYEAAGFEGVAAEEAWLRGLQDTFRDGAVHTDSIGVGIDPETTFGEASEKSAPYIFLAVAAIIILVAFVHRSYWSAAVVGAGLAASSLAAYGTSALLGLRMGSMLLAFVVPIAMISFGVDFYIHGFGRVREAEVEGHDEVSAYPAGMTAVFTAMLLAVSTSVAAFLSNAASGTEAIIEFGIGSAIALVWAYVILGQIAPRVTLRIEEVVGDDPVKGRSRYLYGLGTALMAVFGGLTVALAAVMPIGGAAMIGAFILVAGVVSVVLARVRNRRAAARGRSLVIGHVGAAHGLESVGTVVRSLARWRVITIPIVGLIALAGLAQALTVESGFEIDDFLPTNTDFVESIERVGQHFPSSGEGSSYVYVEGDLTNPANLEAIDRAVDDLDASTVRLGRDANGELIVGSTAADVVRMVTASPDARSSIEAAGVDLSDLDGNGLPDTSAGVAATFRYAWSQGVPAPDGSVAIAADEVGRVLADLGDRQGTAIFVQVGSFTDGHIIEPVQEQLESTAALLVSAGDGLDAKVSGDVIASYRSLESFTRSMVVSLPLALAMALVIAASMLRSLKYAVASVLPIGLVVVGVYAFMATFGYTVNIVTATIAAIAVGVGIDFSTHFTARYREELEVGDGKLEAVRRAGAGTGGALALSAMTSVLGFAVMAMAPTPIFSTFGLLTAVMVALSLAVSILVLPSLLVFLTPEAAGVRDSDESREPVTVTV